MQQQQNFGGGGMGSGAMPVFQANVPLSAMTGMGMGGGGMQQNNPNNANNNNFGNFGGF